eukprot:CAMPEP_0183371264 /NCGR_PEP_ID=MMETSP0164_2-20130417/104865_1 /TAXON_ID=221442 /ORGANISM="Coccolithus pelagicus ssp braarudi, Strain PLY182g" /LENGTH=36 /DNA_ID= /DNA_START= /DNA_END= /DNA_ORIENTATION=
MSYCSKEYNQEKKANYPVEFAERLAKKRTICVDVYQ